MRLFAGTACIDLAESVSKINKIPLGNITVSRFADSEFNVKINEHVRGETVFIVQSTSNPANDNLMELAIIADALKRSDAEKIIAVIPYYGYSRQDRRPYMERTPITSKLIANILEASGINYVITVDIHSDQQQGFFDIPFINTTAVNLFATHIKKNHKGKNIVIVSPDLGGVKRARSLTIAIGNGHNISIIDKRRPNDNVAEVMNIIGDNVEDATCIIIDDIIDTAGTIVECAKTLKLNGASEVYGYATHGVLSSTAIDRITQSLFDCVYITDTIPISDENKEFIENEGRDKLKVISIDKLLAKTMECVYKNKSISDMNKSLNT